MCSVPDQKVGRQLILHRGLHPLIVSPPSSLHKQPRDAVHLAKCAGLCKAGDTVIVAYRDYDSPEKDLALKILKVREEREKITLNSDGVLVVPVRFETRLLLPRIIGGWVD